MNLQGGEVVGNVVAIPLENIDVGERLRAVDPHWAEGLANIMTRDGQLTPIEVCRLDGGRFALVTGGHRLAAASLNDWPAINAIVVSSSWAERRLREVSENLWRRGLDPADRASFMAELVDLARVADGSAGKTAQQVAAAARWSPKISVVEALNAQATMAHAYGWSERVAERVGVSVRTVKRDLQLHRQLNPQAKALLSGHPAYRNAAAMGALAKLDPERQVQIAEMLAAGTIKSVGEGVSTVSQKRKSTPEEKRLAAIQGALGRMGKPERIGVFQTLAAERLAEMKAAVAWAEAQQ